MSLKELVIVAIAAVLVFWSLGAHDRLRRLRAGVSAAWAKVDEALRQRAEGTAPLLAALFEPLAAEHGSLAALQAQLAESARAAQSMSLRPLAAGPASAWVAVEAGVAAAASRVFALLAHDASIAALEPVAAGVQQWRELEGRLAFARQFFNEAAQAYDDAINLFPTRLLAPLFRFGHAGRL